MIPERLYREILDDLQEFESYLTSLRVKPLDKLQGIIANIREIEQAYSQGRAAALETEPRLRELVWSLVEGAELAEIFRGIQEYDRAVIKRLMRNAVIGPVDPGLETGITNIGRNTIFELRMGAGFRRAGASVTLGGRADLSVDHTGVRLYVECKRPLGEQNIARRVEEACAQLRDRFKADTHPNQVGMVAVSISKALNAGEKMLFVNREEDIEPSLTKEAERIYQSYCGSIRTAIDLRVIGFICHVFTPAWVRATGLLTAASQSDIFLTDSFRNVLPVSADALKGLLAQI
jgi:hypothetical protein